MAKPEPGVRAPQTDDNATGPRFGEPARVASIRLRTGLLCGALIGLVFGLAVAAALWPALPGCKSTPPTPAEAASGALLTSAVFAGLFALVGLGVALLGRLFGRTTG